MASSQLSPASKDHRLRNLTLLTLGLLVLIGIPGYILTSRNYVSQHSFFSQNNQPIKVTTARNEGIVMGIKIDNGIDGYWASHSGLQLKLEGVDTPLTVIGPKEQRWGETIRSSSKNVSDPYYAAGTVILPDSIGGAEQRSLKGTLSGSIRYPSGGILFSNKTLDVNVPVEIQLLPQSSFLLSGGRLFFEIFGWLNVVLGSLLLLLAGAALVQAISIRRRIRAAERMLNIRPPGFGQALKDIGLAIFTVSFVLLITSAILIGGLSALSASSPSPEGANTTIFLPSMLIGLAASVGVLAQFVKPEKKRQ